jgi:hypothetical protein
MPNTDHDGLGPGFEGRLKDALDRITPPSSPPRYQSASLSGARTWRLAPVALAVGATCLLALTATAATGSPNPTVWTQRAASTLTSIGHHSEASHSPGSETTPEAGERSAEPGQATPEPEQGGAAPTPSHDAEHEASPKPEPSEAPVRSPSPEPSESPSPSGDHSGSSSNTSPSPTSDSGH